MCEAAVAVVSFGDYKSIGTRVMQGKVPDTVMLTSGGYMLVVGEVKIKWVPKYGLENAEA